MAANACDGGAEQDDEDLVKSSGGGGTAPPPPPETDDDVERGGRGPINSSHGSSGNGMMETNWKSTSK
jgi:hypothetical protein